MAGLLLDRVDHNLDPLAQDDRLHLGHVTTSLRRSSKTTSRQTPCNRPIRSWVPSTRKPNRCRRDRKSTRLNSSHRCISYAVFCLKKKKTDKTTSLSHF